MTGPIAFHDKLAPPATDDTELIGLLACKGYTDDVPLCQFVAWADRLGLLEFLASHASASIDEVITATPLTEPGADALLGVLVNIGLVLRDDEGLALSPLAREYLVPGGPYYKGKSLFVACRGQLPASFVKPGYTGGKGLARRIVRKPANPVTRAFVKALKKLRGWDWGGRRIVENQHSRNLPASVAAAHLPLFDGARCVVDIAGGSGSFAIPLAQRHPEMRIVLADLPQSLPGARRYLRAHGVLGRVELLGMDAFADAWPIPECDVAFFGNFIHGWEREQCLSLARKSRAKLRPGGRIVFHEMVWNETRTGPLATALWNVTMREFGGRQRTVTELHSILHDAGFERLFATPTSGGFVAVGGVRPD